MIKIIEYSPDWHQAHEEFASRYWTKKRRFTPEYIYWKFRGELNKNLTSFLIAVDDRKVIGQFGIIPCEILVKSKIYQSQWACDLMVDNDYRGKNIAVMLYEAAVQQKPITLGSDPSPAATRSMSKFGFKSIIGPRKFIFALNLFELLKIKGLKFPILKVFVNPLYVFFALWKTVRKIIFGINYKFEEVKDFSSLNEKVNGVNHESHFAEWRFNSFGEYYNGFTCYKNKKGLKYLVLKNNSQWIIGYTNAKTIIEHLDIWAEIQAHSIAEKATIVKVYSNSKSESISLILTGFIFFRTRTNIMYYTNDANLERELLSAPFRYSFLDSDENI